MERTASNSPRGNWRFQLSVLDCFCLLSLHAVATAGIVQRVQGLHTHVYYLKPIARSGPISGLGYESVPVPINWYPLLIGTIVLSSVAMLAAFFATRRLLRHTRPQLCQSAARLAAALACLVLIAALAIVYLDGWHYFKQQLLAGDWAYLFSTDWMHSFDDVRWSGALPAAVATIVIAGVEAARWYSASGRKWGSSTPSIKT